ncbi:TolC family outer membrane protein [Halomonas cupida]|uniref:Outer membrane protein n=2 Tax=Halomonas cupida TaxID=44933 RepID=A0A1M7C066_9GAMM|nr:outer membrane protein [Halomonas cupida]
MTPSRLDMPARPARVMFRRKLLGAMVAAMLAGQAQAADLLAITRDALDNNSELAAARATTNSVEEGRDVERADLLPQVNASGEVAYNHIFESQSQAGFSGTAGDDSYASYGLNLQATQALYDAINSREVGVAERQIDQQTYVQASTEQQVLIDTSSAYFDILRAYDILEARLAQERAIGRQLEQAQEQFDVGLIAITEVEEARASFDQSRADRIAAESDLQVAFEALERLTGKQYDSIERLQDDLPIALPEPASREAWIDLALENNPAVLAQQAGVEVARQQVDVARAGHLPQVNAFANYAYSDSDNDAVTNYDSNGQIGVNATLPIYTGGRTSASIRQSTYALESTQYDFESQRREAILQVRSLYTQVSNDVSTVAARQQAIVSNQSALDATRAGYEVGTRNIVDVLNAEQNLYNAIADYADARYDYVVDLLSLRRQSGLLDEEAIAQVNRFLTGEGQVNFTLPEQGDVYDTSMDIGERPQLEQ